jgi:hypothetical protein
MVAHGFFSVSYIATPRSLVVTRPMLGFMYIYIYIVYIDLDLYVVTLRLLSNGASRDGLYTGKHAHHVCCCELASSDSSSIASCDYLSF